MSSRASEASRHAAATLVFYERTKNITVGFCRGISIIVLFAFKMRMADISNLFCK